jgi:hypothetical protein
MGAGPRRGDVAREHEVGPRCRQPDAPGTLTRQTMGVAPSKDSRLDKVERVVNDILRLLPVFRPVFEGTVRQGQFTLAKRISKRDVDSLRDDLYYLRKEDLLDWQGGGFMRVEAGEGAGTFTDLAMNITQRYRAEALGKVILR